MPNSLAATCAIEVAEDKIGRTNVLAQQREEMFVRRPGEQLHHRDQQSLLVDFGARGREIRPPMSTVWQLLAVKPTELFPEEHRRHDRDVVLVSGDQPRIIGDQNVTRFGRSFRKGLAEMLEAEAEATEVPRGALHRLQPSSVPVASKTPADRSSISPRTAEKRLLLTMCGGLLAGDRDQGIPGHLELRDRVPRMLGRLLHRLAPAGEDDDDVAVNVDGGFAHGTDDGRQFRLLDCGRAGQRLAGRKVVAREHRAIAVLGPGIRTASAACGSAWPAAHAWPWPRRAKDD